MIKENVLIVYFNTESEGYQAFTEIRKESFLTDKSTIFEQASLIKKEKGDISAKDFFHHGKSLGEGVLVGSLIGSFVGLLGGPLGVLLGMGVGATIGSLSSFDDVQDNASLIYSVTSRLQENEIAILAVVQEEDESILDEYFSKFDTTIVRYDADVIEEEVEHALELEKELVRQARLQLKQERSLERKQKVEEKRSEIQARFKILKSKLK